MKETKFKDTEIGKIPSDWLVVELNQLCDKIGDIDHRMPKSVENGIPYVMTGDFIGQNEIDFNNAKKVSQNDYEQLIKKIKPEKGDIIFARYASIGAVRLIKTNNPFLVSYSCALIKPGKKIDNTYLFYVFFSSYIQEQEVLSINTGTQGNVGIDSLKKFLIPLPPTLTEQSRIAQALSDIDSLIDSLDKLIQKKRNIKQGAMQELLTGKKRLKGFDGEWEEKQLGEICEFQTGAPFNSNLFNTNGLGVRLIRNRDLKTDEQIVYYSGEYDNSFIVKNGDLLVGMDGDFLPCIWGKGESLLNQRVGRILFKNNHNTKFYYYYLYNPLKQKQDGTGATTVKHLSHKDIENFILPIPPTIEEQTAIATILSDMDSEIESLEAKKGKYKAIKQGMMQELLSGRIRLI